MTEILGLDIGGSGIKGCPVDIDKGELATERFRLETPQPATPENMMKTAAEVVAHYGWKGKPIGVGFPALLRNDVCVFSGNLDTSWNGTNVREQLEQATGCPATVLNDADAAGLAEFQYGAGHEHEGVVLVLTLGTGIGSALFHDGKLVRGTELGQLILKDPDIPELKKGLKGEHYAAASIKARLGLKWREWAPRLQVYLDYVELLFSPDLIILGGGCSRKFEKWGGYLTTHAELVPAELKNQAGIIGAAFAASLPDAPKIIKKPSARTPEPTG